MIESTEAQLKTLDKELEKYVKRGYKLKLHCEISKTECPGKFLKKWVDENYKRSFNS